MCYCMSEAGDLYPGDVIFTEIGAECVILETKNSRRCVSCKEKIKPGQLARVFEREKVPESEAEENIYYGENVPLVPYHLCEACSDLYDNLSAQGGGDCFIIPWLVLEAHEEYKKTVKQQ